MIAQSFKLGPSQVTATNISGVRLTLSKTSDQHSDVSDIWVKYGGEISMGEARTQHFVSQYLHNTKCTTVRAPRVYIAFTWKRFGFIVSELIYGKQCESSDDVLISDAVKTLISIPSPDSRKPGPVGGGLIGHPFFCHRLADIEYESVEDLEDHVNGILTVTERKPRVNFRDEVATHGLRLCPSDLKYVNFLKDTDGGIVAVDFAGYSFLPPSFFVFALTQGSLAYRISVILDYLMSSTNAKGVASASYALVPFHSNKIGELISFFSKDKELTVLTGQAFRNDCGPNFFSRRTRRTSRVDLEP
ncbi:uncharacterized protein LACBIDRAFT_321179 [Laccaria bicolor S238N-H82]|uniref:Predicted protein n=1 Tax=Laccaria bicolor (strain S238N-H82 / ATCC MYA-4686) TaxID=486041 RepID=B0CP01_LACBS|nr:uncharacterized protein LACBIDRAFT_321179 [Laccaria bicolor S238N-H82]EDR15387.1 predicted protein [Laccaria bicolor S238N-H82]|eukprot:XP_001873595.1 predicted protein [Laccaria bicolor S238N-H82]